VAYCNDAAEAVAKALVEVVDTPGADGEFKRLAEMDPAEQAGGAAAAAAAAAAAVAVAVAAAGGGGGGEAPPFSQAAGEFGKADWDGLLDAAAGAAKGIKKEVDDEVARLAESAAAAAAYHPPRSRRGPTNAERFTSIAREKADQEVALIEAAALVLQNACAAFKESEKGAPDAAARVELATPSRLYRKARCVRYWINAVCR
jgi:hypothetical protein